MSAEEDSIESTTRGLGGVFDDRHSCIRRELAHATHVGRVAVEVRNDDRVDSTLDCSAEGGEVRTQRHGIEIVQSHPHTGANGRGAEVDAAVTGVCHGPTTWHAHA